VILASASVPAGAEPAGTPAAPDAVGSSTLTPSDGAGSRVLHVSGLVRRFGGMVAVDALDLDLTPGERLAVIGPNGAGKTTLFRLIAGELRPDAGRIRMLDEDVTRLPAWRRARLGLSRTYQVANLFGRLSVADNLRLAFGSGQNSGWRSLRPMRRDDAIAAETAQLLEQVGLGSRARATVVALSHGEQRQLEIAMALATRPRLLLLDEPAAGLSAAERGMLRSLIQGLPRTLPLVLIEHDMSLVFDLADRVLCLHQGRLVAVGTPDSIRADERVQAVYLGRAHA
jgi:branched-chain amino acid transport system ATP-binding protein